MFCIFSVKKTNIIIAIFIAYLDFVAYNKCLLWCFQRTFMHIIHLSEDDKYQSPCLCIILKYQNHLNTLVLMIFIKTFWRGFEDLSFFNHNNYGLVLRISRCSYIFKAFLCILNIVIDGKNLMNVLLFNFY